MMCKFEGWAAVAKDLDARAKSQKSGKGGVWLNFGQCASLRAIAQRITKNGVIVADEVGMGKTRIAVELARSVTNCHGRVAILVPPGLGYQWQAELREGGIDVPSILRSLAGYLAAWKSDGGGNQEAWFERSIVIVSHAFTNWRLGKKPASKRWALLPEVYARWRSKRGHRIPRGYHGNDHLSDASVRAAAKCIVDANTECQKLDQLLNDVRWPDPLDASNYSRSNGLREWLEFVVGLGLGAFDLVVIDEAHKSRGMESNLSRLLNKVVLHCPNARRLALTATPVELEANQWRHTLSRIGLKVRN